TSLEFSPKQDQLLSTSLDQTVRLWPKEYWSEEEGVKPKVIVLPLHEKWVWSGTYVDWGNYFITAGQDRRVIRWHASMTALAEEVRKLTE
ncbi:MAG: hypothetical protein AAFQ98_16025, partial [Bacteroidota bacterium]